MVQRSDDKGDKRSSGTSTEAGATRDAEANAANALRERIRQAGAGTGAATARASDHAPPNEGLIVPSSSAPPAAEHSGVRTRPPEPRQTSITPPMFGVPKLTPGAVAVPWPAAPRTRPQSKTRVGLGAPATEPGPPPEQLPPAGLGWGEGSTDESEAITADMQVPAAVLQNAPRSEKPTPRGIVPPPQVPAAHPPVDSYTLSTARTQPMPRVRSGASAAANSGSDSANAERRRVELATTRKNAPVRIPESSTGQAGRYSVQDAPADYIDSGAPEPISDAQATGEGAGLPDPAAFESDSSASGEPEAEAEGSRPRRSTPKQRVGHRRSTRPEGHGRERGTKRTDPGIRARTLRGGNVGPLTPMSPPSGAAPMAPPPGAALVRPPPGAALVPPPPGAALVPPPPGAALVRPPPGAASARPAIDPGTVLVDPSLRMPQPPTAAPPAKAKPQSGYVPLPRDREAYEAFLRSAAGEHGGPPRARPSWAQQETALIPRDSLQPSFEYPAERTSSRAVWLRGVLGLILIAVSIATLWWTFFREESPGTHRALDASKQAPSTPPGAARPITLIATEPSGAEVLLERAVIGNTPLEVTRPADGEALYIVRLKNFEQQMVRITNATHNAIHITLTPLPSEAPPKPAPRR